MKNWAGNLEYSASSVARPSTVEEVQGLVAGSSRVKALGTRHSFSPVADTSGIHLSTERLNRIGPLDAETGLVLVEPGVRYGDLSASLKGTGWAVANLASLPHISCAGACATATHGSGDRNGCLSTSVASMKFVMPDGSLREVVGSELHATTVHLGRLGVVVELGLQLVPEFEVREYVFQNLSWKALESHFDAITSAGYSVSLFLKWGEDIDQVWVKSKVELDLEYLFGALAARTKLHPIGSMPAEFCTDQLGIPGPSADRLPHFKLEFTPSQGEELQSEYLVPRQWALAALREMRDLGHQIAPLLHVSEIRTVAKDPLWLSMANDRDSVAIHFTWKDNWPAVRELLSIIESRLRPFEPRPHWGKLHMMNPSEFYPHWGSFERLSSEWDPSGKFA